MSVTVAQVVVPLRKMEIFTPNRAELEREGATIRCQEPNCSGMFKCQSNLALHLIKVHKKADVTLSSRSDTQFCFYCPEEGCLYNRQRNLAEGEEHFFTELKQLKQHFMKVHKERKYECKNCAKTFPDESTHRRHEKSCGFKFYCSVCGASYRNQPSLVYHVKQKGHLYVWSDLDTLWEQHFPEAEETKKKGGRKRNQAIQTETKKRGVSQTTQTSRTAKKKKLASTTIDAVQTVEVASTQTLPFDFDLFDVPYLTDNSSQTARPSSSHIETQTERDVFLSEAQDSDSTDLLLFNHTHTQTTEEIFSEFNDIQTQTHYDTDFDFVSDFLVSTETQTPRFLLGMELSSTHTQTMDDFLYDSTSSHTQT